MYDILAILCVGLVLATFAGGVCVCVYVRREK